MTSSWKRRNRCCVKDCIRIETDSTFRFPMNELRSRLWVKRCGNESLYKLSTKKLYQTKKLCERHFAPHAFTNVLKIRLNFDAVPSIFPHNNFQAAESSAETPQEENSMPVLSSAKIPEKEINLPVSMDASTEEILPEQFSVPLPSPASSKEFISEEYNFPMPISANREQIQETQYHSKPPVTMTNILDELPASPDLIITKVKLPVSLPAKTKQIPKKNYYINVLSASAGTEEIIIEESNFPLPLSANTEKIQEENLYSEVLSSNCLNIDTKLANSSQKKLPPFCHTYRNEHKQSSKTSNVKKVLSRPANNTGNKIFVVASQCPVKPMDFSRASCGLAGCNDDLYSDAKISKKLVKCSSKCKRFFHLQCTGLEKEEYNILCKNDALRWFCLECRRNL